MTTKSAGNGPSAGDGSDESDGGWGWFTPARPATEAAPHENEQGDEAGRAQHRPQTGQQTAATRHGADNGGAGNGGAAPSPRPLGAVVDGAGAGRARWAETPEEAAIPVPAPPDPTAAGTPRTPPPPPSYPPPPPSYPPPGAADHGQRGAPAPGAWPGAGPEAPREHPTSSPYGRSGSGDQPAQAAQSKSKSKSKSRTQPPSKSQTQDRSQARTPAQPRPGPRPRTERQPQPRSPLYDEALASAAPPADGAESRDTMLIRRTLEEIEPRADAATSYFYALLFVQHPELRDLFPASMDAQRDRLFKALLTAVSLADEVEALTDYLAGLGRGHRKYGTQPEHYPAVGECLLGALARYAPESWGQETEEAWVRAYTAISQAMIDAAAEDAQHSPAWWNAQIVSHQLRTSDIAVITLRPDQPYPFLAGQYTSVETPWWPRVWRHYSFASSPRSDGLLTFHVKAVPTGWVSNALVNRARPGDVVRLGRPAGSMTVDHATDSGMLCVGGGTGIAPIRALVEDVAEHGRTRPVEVFYGARSDHDLYDLDTMMRLEKQHRWLSVRPVVATPPGSAFANALSGQLPDAVRQHGPWTAYDGYLSGPPGMIRSGVDALVASGVPAERIRHDSLAELMAGAERTSE